MSYYILLGNKSNSHKVVHSPYDQYDPETGILIFLPKEEVHTLPLYNDSGELSNAHKKLLHLLESVH